MTASSRLVPKLYIVLISFLTIFQNLFGFSLFECNIEISLVLTQDKESLNTPLQLQIPTDIKLKGSKCSHSGGVPVYVSTLDEVTVM